MKKKPAGLILLLLCAALLCGCTGIDTIAEEMEDAVSSCFVQGEIDTAEMIPFSRMEYIRPDMETITKHVDAVIAALEGGESLRNVEALIDICYADYNSFDTMYTIADIRSCLDAGDRYYAEEYLWCAENYPVLDELFDGMYYACAGSKLGNRLERFYFWDGFCEEYADESKSRYNDTTVELMQRESDLVAQYRALSASPVIEIDGENYDFWEYSEGITDSEYIDALIECQRQMNAEYARVYIELIKIRNRLAAELGYDSYEQMQYDDFFERDYTPGDAAAYIADIRTHLVPLYEQALEMGAYEAIAYQRLPEKKLLRAVKTAAENLCGDSAEAFRFMEQYELFDLSRDDGKADMSFTSYLTDYEAPYLFLSPNGELSDVCTFTHEFGHYLDAYFNCNASETIDVAEVFSQGLEYLALSRYGDALTPAETESLRTMKMLDTLDMYVVQASFAEFESGVYALGEDELSAERINALMLEVAREYGYCERGYEDYYSMIWTDIAHFWEMPFYVISYPVSNDLAMQIYELEKQQEGRGAEKYLTVLDRDYDSLLQLVEKGGFSSPFEEGRIEQVAGSLRAELTIAEAAA